MGTLKQEIITGIQFQENDLENPVFTWQGNDYACVPSVNEFKRTLDTGGFVIDKLLTMVVRLLDENGNAIFDTLPTAQQIITYNNQQFRIENTKTHPTGAYLRIMAMGVTRGL